jgi:3-hydroxybutyryl-CoA dehydrogenase/3-hydroxyacyl-CoA dehydrogenase
MGSGIAQVLAIAGCPVVLRDIDSGVLERAVAEIGDGRFGVASAVARGKLSAEQAEAAKARITYELDLDALADVDVVIEAVPERLALKIEIFRELDRITSPHAILASNSSGFPISALAAATDRPAQVIGWHWASPAPVMRLAEIVRTPATSEASIDVVCALARSAGKNPLVVNDHETSWGYVANRVYAAMYREARQVIADGVADAAAVDQLLVDCFRWPTGPFGMSSGAGSGWKA